MAIDAIRGPGESEGHMRVNVCGNVMKWEGKNQAASGSPARLL